MISRCDNVSARIEYPLRRARIDAVFFRGVFSVYDYSVRAVSALYRGQFRFQCSAARAAYNVADKNDPHITGK